MARVRGRGALSPLPLRLTRTDLPTSRASTSERRLGMMCALFDAFPGVVLCDDVEPADWVLAALRPWTDQGLQHISSLVPADYRAHGRILHRAWSSSRNVRWGEIASRTGQTMLAETRYNELVGWHPDSHHQSPPSPWGQPNPGSLLRDECAAVGEVLAGYTTTPDECWFCLWDGYGTGWPVLNRLGERAPRVGLEHRNCFLFRGPVSAGTAFRSKAWFQSPTLWWPTDRAWCVASELDIFSTYVAGTPASLRALMGHPSLEVLECTAEQEIDPSPYPPRNDYER
jgi:hypothetical protein